MLAIRRGEVELENLIQTADKEIKAMDDIFNNSSLPNKVDQNLVNELLVSIRKQFYQREKKKRFSLGWPFN